MQYESIADKVRELLEKQKEQWERKAVSEFSKIIIMAERGKKSIIVTAPNGHQLIFHANKRIQLRRENNVPFDIGEISFSAVHIAFLPTKFSLQTQREKDADEDRIKMTKEKEMENIVFAMLSQPECLFVTFGDN